jgi:Xaa-Pro aminopeptidase
MADTPRIPDSEFQQRWETLQQKMDEHDLDVVIAHGHEADPANVRYLSDYWPLFETGGVAVGREGAPALLIGPESLTFAQGRSRIPQIMQILQYRESAEPDYPGMELDTFGGVFDAVGGGDVKRIGIAGMSILPVTIHEAIVEAAGDAEVVKADELLTDMRMVKSENELACMREAFRISEVATQAVLDSIAPGMTEQQVVGIAQGTLYAEGAEYEGHPTYVLSADASTHAIGRPSPKVIEEGEMIQLNIGALVSGYSSSVGRPICIGEMPADMRELVEVGLDAHHKTMELMQAGVPAAEVVVKFEEYLEEKGYAQYLLYGPCHSIGLMEVERPWMETSSEYDLVENMTYQVDTFLYKEGQFGLRWEDGVVVKEDGVEMLSDMKLEVIEL